VPEQVPAEIVLGVGEDQGIALGSLSTAGYVWEPTIEGPEDVVDVSSGPSESSDPVKPGVSRAETVVVRGLRPGHVTLRLAQRRPWEEGPPLREHAVQVTVQS
jgi:Chagasin family peptidase inhibitor I42